MPEKEQKPQTSQSFSQLLAELGDGEIIQQIDSELLELMRRTTEVASSRGVEGKAIGALSIKVTFKVSARGEAEIAADHSIKPPKFPSAITRRWVDPKTSAIIDRNPKQMALPLRDAIPAATELRSVT
jgi:hypothetical protein